MQQVKIYAAMISAAILFITIISAAMNIAAILSQQDQLDGIDLRIIIIITAHTAKLEIWFYLARCPQKGLQE